MPQFFINQSVSKGSSVAICGRDAHHITHVLRLNVGDWLVISNGQGRSFKAVIKSLAPKKVWLLVKEEKSLKKNPFSPALAFAVIKHDRTEYIIQKSVELGCADLMPFFSSRTVPQYSNNIGQKKMARWQKIAEEAAKQSGLPFKPRVQTPVSFEELCTRFAKYGNVFLFWEGEENRDLKSISKSIPPSPLIVIGPEGGFSREETDLAKKHGAATISLGPQILRVETAALVALGIIQYEMGNLSPWKK
jgi:16S rRNA (uracil1498-N3)-methyltransferase